MKKVDVAINVYGKPFQTAVTLLSLVKHSDDHINKIYFVTERRQPDNSDFDFIYKLLGEKLITYTPKRWLWYNSVEKKHLENEAYRLSIRYQFAWEKTNCDYLYLTHNDVLYEGDIIGALLDNIENNIGIGRIGQCWNCPAFSANVCNGDKYLTYRPSYEEVVSLASRFPPPRGNYEQIVDKENAWTLPECRLNEWVALINMKLAKPITIPVGDCYPFGGMQLDIGTRWFRDVSLKGYTLKNYDFENIAKHAWTTEINNGHSALFDKKLYDTSEDVAREKLISDFGIDAKLLISKTSNSGIKKLMNFFSGKKHL